MNPRPDAIPLLAAKNYAAPAVFEPTNLLREARRQRGLANIAVPAVGLLDPDGDIVRYLAASGRGRPHPGWACYHTEMWTTSRIGRLAAQAPSLPSGLRQTPSRKLYCGRAKRFATPANASSCTP